jgi:hypothetical protein
VGVISNAVATQASNQNWYIETPTHNPEDASIGLFTLKAVVQKSEVALALAVGDHLRGA